MSKGMMTYNNFFDSSYHYGSMMSKLIDSNTVLNFRNDRMTDKVGMDKILQALNGYKERDLEVILVYDPILGMLKNDFLGAHFIKGKFLNISENAITFQGPDGISHGGIKTPGSPYLITPRNMIDVFAARCYERIQPEDNWGLKVYEFSILHGPKIGEIMARTSLEGFMELARSTESMKMESERGYTTPVKLDNISFLEEKHSEKESQDKSRKIPPTEKFDIKVARSEFSKSIKVHKYGGSGTGTGY